MDGFFQNARLNVAANYTFLTLIPKRQGAHRVDQFRPIDMAVKEDMAKAYDKVEWKTLLQLLRMHDFHDIFCNMIQECVSSATYSILINGPPCGFFPSSRGLFTILANLLS